MRDVVLARGPPVWPVGSPNQRQTPARVPVAMKHSLRTSIVVIARTAIAPPRAHGLGLCRIRSQAATTGIAAKRCTVETVSKAIGRMAHHAATSQAIHGGSRRRISSRIMTSRASTTMRRCRVVTKYAWLEMCIKVPRNDV